MPKTKTKKAEEMVSVPLNALCLVLLLAKQFEWRVEDLTMCAVGIKKVNSNSWEAINAVEDSMINCMKIKRAIEAQERGEK